MVWINRIFRKRDMAVLICGVIAMQLLMHLLIDRFMFHPVTGGYDRNIDGYVELCVGGETIAARALGPTRGQKAILFCHGNAEDLTSVDGRFDELISDGITVVAFDYPGYGMSTGTPTEEGCYRSCHALYDWLIKERGFTPQDIFVVGFSIGSGVAVELASKCPVGGLWLEAPFLSAPRAVTRFRLLVADPFPNIRRIGKLSCPVVIMHGTKDRIVPFVQGQRLFKAIEAKKRFIVVEGAGHTDLMDIFGKDAYERELGLFVSHE